MRSGRRLDGGDHGDVSQRVCGRDGGGSRRIGASFRDPAAFVFTRDGVLYRQVNSSAAAAYDTLMSSGLYAALVDAGDLVSHEEMDPALSFDGRAYRVLKPKPVPFVSYPYEWCFSELKDAALLTLRLQRTAMRFGMSLKDATAFNVQFDEGRPVWIDTLSFEPLRKGAPWVAYRQFCEFFVAPLALMSCTDVRLQQLLRVFLDGVPVEIASRLLPFRTRAWGGLGVHVHLHARAGHRSGQACGRLQPASSRARAVGPDRQPRPDGEGAEVEAGRHGLGQLLRCDQLHRGGVRAQAPDRRRSPRPLAAVCRLGPRRQRRDVQPAGCRSRKPGAVVRRRPGRRGEELPTHGGMP